MLGVPGVYTRDPEMGDAKMGDARDSRDPARGRKHQRRSVVFALGGAAIVVVAGWGWCAARDPDTSHPWTVSFFPTESFEGKEVVAHAEELAFQWGSEAPVSGVLGDQFSVLARTCLVLPHPETLRFELVSDDGSRLMVDGRVAIDNWGVHGARTESVEIAIPAGEHRLDVEYFDRSTNAELRLVLQHADGRPLPPGWLRPIDAMGEACAPTAEPPAPDAPHWRAQYHADDQLGGTARTREEPRIHHLWEDSAPLEDVPADHFSVRWDACLTLDESGPIEFELTSDDGSRLFVDGLTVVDNWSSRGVRSRSETIALVEGRHHLRVEYFEDSSNAMIALRTRTAWGMPLDPHAVSVPSPSDPACGLRELPGRSTDPAWHGRYYADRESVGEPVLEREDPAIDFRWGEGPAAEQLPADDFFVRWDGCLPLDGPTTMHFRLESDDGSRLVVDGRVVVDNWGVHGERAREGSINLRAGVRHLRVEYFDGSVNAMVTLYARQPDSQWGVLDGRWMRGPAIPFDPDAPCAEPSSAQDAGGSGT